MDRQKLMEENHNLIYKYMFLHNLNEDEWYDLLAIEYVQCCLAWQPEKGKLSTFVYKSFDNEIKNALWYKTRSKRNNGLETNSFDEEIPFVKISHSDGEGETTLHDIIGNQDINFNQVELQDIIDRAIVRYKKHSQSRKDIDIIIEKLLQGDTKADIARDIGISYQGVGSILKTFAKHLNQYKEDIWA